MKAKSIFEILKPIKKLIYKNNPHVLVKTTDGKYERHYYKINEKKELLIYGKQPDEEGSLRNPTIKGTPSHEEDGRYLLRYTEGENFAFPIDELRTFENKINIDLKIKTAYSIGFLNGRNNNPSGGKKGIFEDPMNLVLIFLVIGTLISLFLIYTGFTDQGVIFFGGQS